MKAISLSRYGGPEVLQLDPQAPQPTPASSQVLVQVSYAGVNYIDTYYREGIYPHDLPFIPGFEGVGTVVHDPQGEIATGTRVAWCDGLGSYAEYVCVPRDRLVAVAEDVDGPTAASMLLQGITAHYLSHGVYPLAKGDTCVITAGAGGVGLILTQLAVAAGATVISLVSTDDKEQLSREAGAQHVLRYSDHIAADVRELTDDRGVDVVYDGVGAATFAQSLKSLRPKGTLALFGAASGPVEKFDPQELNAHGSLFLTRPSIGAWTSGPGEFAMRAQAITQAIADGSLSIRVGHVYDLKEAAQAHRDLQQRKTTGSLVLKVSD